MYPGISTVPFVFQSKGNSTENTHVCIAKDSFISQDRNEDFVGGQLESTFSQGHCDLTSGTISKNGAK